MSELTIRSNHHFRFPTYGYEFVKDEYDQYVDAETRSQFDYYNDEEFEQAEFVNYKGHWYDMAEFMRVNENFPPPMNDWDGYSSDSYFSGVVVKFSDDYESVKMGTYIS